MAIQYNNPLGGTKSTIGTQIRTDFFQRKALIDAVKEQYFSQLADVTAMPKNYGKKIKLYHYLPLLSDANINDQGIDAAGLTVPVEKTIVIFQGKFYNDKNGYFAVGSGADSAAATTAAQTKAIAILVKLGFANAAYATIKAAAIAGGWFVDDTAAAVPNTGNLYGSSKDVGTIVGKLPVLSETGGRVNRVGFRRIEIEGEITKLGFFDEYTQESLDFDSDAELLTHINREMLNGASEITEDALQIDLLNGAGTIRYAGAATSNATISGEAGAVCEVDYSDLMRLSIDLDNNRTPKKTTYITGTRMVDTVTIDAARPLFVGSEMIPTIRAMKDLHNNPAFIPAHKYAAGADIMRGEIGSVDQFRIIVVPEMMNWTGAGATATGGGNGYRETGGKYDVYPLLVVGEGSFTTIGFQTDGKSFKFQITHKAPGRETADRTDPYGETGFMSIKWYYGTMILRPERIALVKSVARV
jgi:N4-gp56 family major capsid protein